MFIKVPGGLLNGGATATARYNYSNVAQIKWDRQLKLQNDNITIVEHKCSYYKLRLDGVTYRDVVVAYQGNINGWIVTTTWHCNLQTGMILKYTFDKKEDCDKFETFIKTNPIATIYANCNQTLTTNSNGYQTLKYKRVNDTVIYCTFSRYSKIGRINETGEIGFAWIQLARIGEYGLTCTLEIEFFDPYFNDDELQGFMSAPDKETAAKYYEILFKRLKTTTSTQTFYLNGLMLNYLNDDVKKIATDKGWTLA